MMNQAAVRTRIEVQHDPGGRPGRRQAREPVGGRIGDHRAEDRDDEADLEAAREEAQEDRALGRRALDPVRADPQVERAQQVERGPADGAALQQAPELRIGPARIELGQRLGQRLREPRRCARALQQHRAQPRLLEIEPREDRSDRLGLLRGPQFAQQLGMDLLRRQPLAVPGPQQGRRARKHGRDRAVFHRAPERGAERGQEAERDEECQRCDQRRRQQVPPRHAPLPVATELSAPARR
jgi:hypothetical protein